MTTKFSQPRYSLTNVSGMLQVDGSYILVRVDECTFLCSGRAIKARLEGYRIPKRPQTGEQPAFQMIRDCFSKRPTKGAFQDVYLDIIIQHAGGREGDYRIEQVLDVSQRTTGVRYARRKQYSCS